MSSKKSSPAPSLPHSAPAPLAPIDPLQRYSVDETVRYLRTSKPTFYADVRAGRIKTIKHGRRRYVSGAEIARVSS
jgi:excisionase family DNA binding protein